VPVRGVAFIGQVGGGLRDQGMPAKVGQEFFNPRDELLLINLGVYAL
jgi:hypothetical protein